MVSGEEGENRERHLCRKSRRVGSDNAFGGSRSDSSERRKEGKKLESWHKGTSLYLPTGDGVG